MAVHRSKKSHSHRAQKVKHTKKSHDRKAKTHKGKGKGRTQRGGNVAKPTNH